MGLINNTSVLIAAIVCASCLDIFASGSSYEKSADLENYSVTKAKWHGKVITYKTVSPPYGLSKYDWDVANRAALNLWSSVIPIEFRRVTDGGKADIEVTKKHIDGANGIVANAYPPADNNDRINGDVTLDLSEYWYSSYRPPTSIFGVKRSPIQAPVGPDSYIDVYQVLIHSFGISLGMKENHNRYSIMYKKYLDLNVNTLARDDIAGIRSLYGVRNGPAITVPTTTTTTTTTTRRPPQTTTQEPAGGYDKCKDGKIDAITMGTDGEAYAFRGIRFFQLRNHYSLPVKTELISQGWKGLPDFIDAAVYLDGDKRFGVPMGTYFFKGFDVYRFIGRTLQAGYPKKIGKVFPGIPHELDSVWKITGRLFARKGTKCYEVEAPFTSRDILCSRRGTVLENLKAKSIDAAFLWPKYGHTYYFSGDKYYRLQYEWKNNSNYPKSTRKYFLGCK